MVVWRVDEKINKDENESKVPTLNGFFVEIYRFVTCIIWKFVL